MYVSTELIDADDLLIFCVVISHAFVSMSFVLFIIQHNVVGMQGEVVISHLTDFFLIL